MSCAVEPEEVPGGEMRWTHMDSGLKAGMGRICAHAQKGSHVGTLMLSSVVVLRTLNYN